MIRRSLRAIAQNLCMVVALVAAGPASALSCLQPTIPVSYGAANDRTATFRIAVGELTPEHLGTRGGGAQQVPATFTGRFFNGAGFGGASEQSAVTIEVNCTASWCGSVQAVSDGLFFFRQDAGGLVLEANACPLFVYPDVTGAMRRQVIACHALGC